MRTVPQLCLADMFTFIDPSDSNHSKESTTSIPLKSNTRKNCNLFENRDLIWVDSGVNLKKGLYEGNRLSDSQFRSSLRNSAHVRNLLRRCPNPPERQCRGRGTHNTNTTTERTNSFTRCENETSKGDVHKTKEHLQHVSHKRTNASSKTTNIRDTPNEEVIASFGMSNLPESMDMSHRHKNRYMIKPDESSVPRTKLTKTCQILKFTFFEDLTDQNQTVYDTEDNVILTSRFPENTAEDPNLGSFCESELIVAQENSQVKINRSREKSFLTKMRSL